jgi:hypothetical protein
MYYFMIVVSEIENVEEVKRIQKVSIQSRAMSGRAPNLSGKRTISFGKILADFNPCG